MNHKYETITLWEGDQLIRFHMGRDDGRKAVRILIIGAYGTLDRGCQLWVKDPNKGDVLEPVIGSTYRINPDKVDPVSERVYGWEAPYKCYPYVLVTAEVYGREVTVERRDPHAMDRPETLAEYEDLLRTERLRKEEADRLKKSAEEQAEEIYQNKAWERILNFRMGQKTYALFIEGSREDLMWEIRKIVRGPDSNTSRGSWLTKQMNEFFTDDKLESLKDAFEKDREEKRIKFGKGLK